MGAMDQIDPQQPPAEIRRHTVTPGELRGFAEVLGLRSSVLERCSMQFLLLVYAGSRGAPVGDPRRLALEVSALEGNLHAPGVLHNWGTKPAEEFDRPPLRGFWRKHYVLGGLSSFAVNVKLAMGKKNRRLREVIHEYYNPDTPLTVEAVPQLAGAIAGLYQERAMMGELTGEWIIFARHEEQNYYLSLATHVELKADGGAALVERIKGCISEFPFLAEQVERAAL